MGRCFHPIAQVSIIGMLSLLVGPTADADDIINNDRVYRKVAVIELSRSFRSFTVSTLVKADCLVKQGRLRRCEANQAVPSQLREVGISQHVMSNQQVLMARDLVIPLMDENCSIRTVDATTAKTLVDQELQVADQVSTVDNKTTGFVPGKK